MEPQTSPSAGRRLLDMTINVQSLVMALIGGIVAVSAAYFAVISRVDRLEAREQNQDDRMTRIEQTQVQQKSETTQQLRDISSDLKDVRNLLMSNAAAARPEIKRWSR